MQWDRLPGLRRPAGRGWLPVNLTKRNVVFNIRLVLCFKVAPFGSTLGGFGPSEKTLKHGNHVAVAIFATDQAICSGNPDSTRTGAMAVSVEIRQTLSAPAVTEMVLSVFSIMVEIAGMCRACGARRAVVVQTTATKRSLPIRFSQMVPSWLAN
jgi:hypothetical protein